MLKRGLWVFLGASAVAGAMIVTTGCGDDGSDGTPAGGGAAGAAGKGGSTSKGGSGGSVGDAGTGGGSGTGGKGGSAGAGATSAAQKALGRVCTKDSDCKEGGKCLTETTPVLDGAAIPSGMCTIDCLNAGEGEDPCGSTAVCVVTSGTTAAPEAAFCLLTCEVGAVPFETEDVPGALDKRCGGRRNMRCAGSAADSNEGFCLPFCAANPEVNPQIGGLCPDTLACDTLVGGCVPPATLEGLKKTGDSCTFTDDPAAARECSGQCIPFGAPAGAKTAPGVCADGCLLASDMCADGGLCAFSTDGAGFLDAGACTEQVGKNKDEECNWQLGFFAQPITVDENGTQEWYCFGSAECKNDSECRTECTTDLDCGAEKVGQEGPEGKCVNKFCSIQKDKCYVFDATTSVKSACLDHQPKVAGATPTDPTAGGAGGSGGAGGASGGAGGAAAGAGGAAAGAGGAAAGAGGAAAGAGGSDAGAGGAAAGAAGSGSLATPFQ